MPSSQEQQATKKLLILSGIVDLLLGAGKIAVGLFANSYALVVDGVHSLSDLLTDLMVWALNAIGSQAPDDDHPYGHARFETFGTFALGILLLLVAAYIVYESSQRMLMLTEQGIPQWPALLATVVSVLAKEWLYRITLVLADKQNSKLLKANAWHHRTDSLSSIIVMIGIIGALLGFPWLELVAAIGVGIMIAIIGWELIRDSVEELVDTALSDSYVEAIKASIEDVEGVNSAHSIRTRRMGSDVIVEVHLQVRPLISVSEGHHIGEWVSRKLEQQFSEVNDVIVHIDAEDDHIHEDRESNELPPLRKVVRTELMQTWTEIVNPDDILQLDLHYLDGKIDVNLLVKKTSTVPSSGELEATANEILWLGRVRIWHPHNS